MTSRSPRKKIDPSRYIIDHKNRVSYSGDVYHKKDIDSLWKHFDRYKAWVDELLK